MSWFDKIKASVTRSRAALLGLETIALAKRPLDAAFWEEFEEILIAADFGFATTEKITSALRGVAKQDRYETSDQVIARFKRDVKNFLTLPEMGLRLDAKPAVILIVGVNGSGKTTTIGKLATAMKRGRRKVLLVAADTFRAAAAEQLTIWAERAGVDIVRGNEGADPSSVVFDGMVAAKSRGAEVVLVDTAGRLQTKTNLMEELKKMRRVIERETGAPTQLTGVIVTKLDSTAKGGVLVGIVDQLTVPIKYIGLGETADALQAFDPDAFTKALFEPAA
jgi:fused signal recognition particle receptor